MDELQEPISINLRETPQRSRFWMLFVFIAIIIVAGLGWYLSSAPADFPVKTFLKVRQGDTLVEVADRAQLLHIVRSSTALKLAVKVLGNDKQLKAGDYYFDKKVSFWTVADYLATGNFNINPARVVLYEGISRKQMAVRLAKDLPYFNSELFMKETETKEGFLFPDTYFISPAADTDEVIALLESSYEREVAPLRADITASGMTERDVIILASIVEKEAAGPVDRTTVAGILLNRIKKGMHLQVDAPFLYALDIPQSQLTSAVLKIDSPYNTYTRAGLPVGPIGSPGIASVKAVLHPTKSDYFFYLHDSNGGVHYALTFAEHKRNIQDFLIH